MSEKPRHVKLKDLEGRYVVVDDDSIKDGTILQMHNRIYVKESFAKWKVYQWRYDLTQDDDTPLPCCKA